MGQPPKFSTENEDLEDFKRVKEFGFRSSQYCISFVASMVLHQTRFSLQILSNLYIFLVTFGLHVVTILLDSSSASFVKA